MPKVAGKVIQLHPDFVAVDFLLKAELKLQGGFKQLLRRIKPLLYN